MSARKIRNKWWVDFRFNHKRYRKKSPDNSKAGAQAYESLLRSRLARGEDIEAKLERSKDDLMVFTDFVWQWFDTYVKVNNKPSTIRAKSAIIRVHLIPEIGKIPLDEINNSRIEQYKLLKQKEGLSNKSINNHLSVLNTCLSYARDWGHIDKIPAIKRLKLAPARFVYFTEEESIRLLQVASTSDWYSMILCALRTGMRFGELCGLDWQDVNFTNGKITVRHSLVEGTLGSPKNNKIRVIPMTTDLKQALYPVKESRGFVFTYEGEAVRNFIAYKALNAIYKQAGLRKAGWHALRHTFASTLVARGASMRSVQELLGHSTIAMTERYAHLAPSVLNETVSLLEPRKTDFNFNFGQQVGNAKQKNPELLSFFGGNGGS